MLLSRQALSLAALLVLALPAAAGEAADGEVAASEFERLGEKLYYNQPLSTEEEALLRKAAARWGETEAGAARVIVAAWMDTRWGRSSQQGAGNTGGASGAGGTGNTSNSGQGLITDTGIDWKLIALLVGVGVAELGVLLIYLTWWRRRREQPIPPFIEPGGNEESSVIRK